MTQIDAVVFDIGMVLLSWDPDGYYDRTYGRARREALYAAVDLDGMNIHGDLGEDLGELTEALAVQHPDFKAEILDWNRNWAEMAQPGIPGTAVLLRALKAKGMPVFSLTNFNQNKMLIAEQMNPVLQEFDRRFVSGELRLIKPDPAFYAALETESGVAPERLLFTDDKPENIAAAEARGWHTHLFDGPEGLAKKLVSLGLLTSEEARF